MRQRVYCFVRYCNTSVNSCGSAAHGDGLRTMPPQKGNEGHRKTLLHSSLSSYRFVAENKARRARGMSQLESATPRGHIRRSSSPTTETSSNHNTRSEHQILQSYHTFPANRPPTICKMLSTRNITPLCARVKYRNPTIRSRGP